MASPAPSPPYFTTSNGAPLANPNATQRIGDQLRATLLLQDIHLLEVIQHLTHERIPERFVHARGTGARGYFEVTDDITDLSSASFLGAVGRRTRLFCRLSTTAGESGSAETVRDTRGFAFKLFTDEGNCDWLFLSTPVFSIRDGAKFPSLVHATKRNPQTGLPDANMTWDFFTQNPETNHFLMFLFSDRSTPEGYQFSDVFSINTYRFTKPPAAEGDDPSFVYVKIHMKPTLGVRNFSIEKSRETAGRDPDFHTRSLAGSIREGQADASRLPAWDVFAQVVAPEQVETLPVNIFDPTKTLPQDQFPLRRFGRIVLDEEVDNVFAETEQSAFSPTNVVPGWGLTPDPILQTRALAYPDTQRHRLGVNFSQLPVNRPPYSFNPLVRDGAGTVDGNLGGAPGYFPSSFLATGRAPQYAQPDEELWGGTVVSFVSPRDPPDSDFAQARIFYEQTLGGQEGGQEMLVKNIADSLKDADSELVRGNAFALFSRISADLGARVEAATMQAIEERRRPKLADGFAKIKLADGAPPLKVNGAGQNFGMFAHKTWSPAK